MDAQQKAIGSLVSVLWHASADGMNVHERVRAAINRSASEPIGATPEFIDDVRRLLRELGLVAVDPKTVERVRLRKQRHARDADSNSRAVLEEAQIELADEFIAATDTATDATQK